MEYSKVNGEGKGWEVQGGGEFSRTDLEYVLEMPDRVRDFRKSWMAYPLRHPLR